MNATTQDTLFPLPEPSLPVEESFASPVERYQYVMRVQETYGGLLPQNLVPELLGLTPARVSQFLSEGRFETVIIFGKRFITAPSIASFIAEERKSGVHIKKPGKVELVAACFNSAKNLLSSGK